jgi:hypothetical protein
LKPLLYEFPSQAAYGKVLPKSKFYEQVRPSRSIRDGFTAQIEKIIWQCVLAPHTLNLPATRSVEEIAVFEISLKTGELDENILRTIDKAIRLPIIYMLTFAGKVKYAAAYKRPNEADTTRWVVDTYFESPWTPADAKRTALPIAGLYEQMLRRLMPEPPRKGEALKEQVERLVRIRSMEAEYRKIEARLQKEKQFNRKVELNAQLRSLRKELETLTS